MAPALIILALWVVLLAPGVARWCREHQPTTSIASFHRQLRLLEHAGPKIVEPAYRLGGAGAPWMGRRAVDPPAPPPRLVLLSSAASVKEPTMRYDDRYEDRYAAHAPDQFVDAYDEWGAEPATPATRGRHAAMSYRETTMHRFSDFDAYDEGALAMSPERARARRRIILISLGGATLATAVLGFIPDLSMLWVLTVLGAIATAAYVGLMYYAANIGWYSKASYPAATPVARVVVPATFTAEDDYDDRFGYGQVASAR